MDVIARLYRVYGQQNKIRQNVCKFGKRNKAFAADVVTFIVIVTISPHTQHQKRNKVGTERRRLK